jgi:hypothetical protein
MNYLLNEKIKKNLNKIQKKKIIIKKHFIIEEKSIFFSGYIIKESTSIGPMSLVNKNAKSWNVYFSTLTMYKKKENKYGIDSLTD